MAKIRMFRTFLDGRKDIPADVRFFLQVDQEGPTMRPDLTPCWVWTGCMQPSTGRPIITVHGEQMYAYQYSYAYHIGEIDPAMVIMHICDNKICVNPDHLQQGTQLENIADMNAKGRNRGGRKPRRKK